MAFGFFGASGFACLCAERTGARPACAVVRAEGFTPDGVLLRCVGAERALSRPARLSLRAEEGDMLFRIAERDARPCQILLSGFKLHLLALEEQYPENLCVTYTEV